MIKCAAHPNLMNSNMVFCLMAAFYNPTRKIQYYKKYLIDSR